MGRWLSLVSANGSCRSKPPQHARTRVPRARITKRAGPSLRSTARLPTSAGPPGFVLATRNGRGFVGAGILIGDPLAGT